MNPMGCLRNSGEDSSGFSNLQPLLLAGGSVRRGRPGSHPAWHRIQGEVIQCLEPSGDDDFCAAGA